MKPPFPALAYVIVSVLTGCTSQPPGSRPAQVAASQPACQPLTQPASQWPVNIEQAVDRLLAGMSDGDRKRIRGMEEDELMDLHMGLGMWIRSNFGLWQGNKQLMESTGKTHPDDASVVIIRALWKRLRCTAAAGP